MHKQPDSVGIVFASYNPNKELFIKQIESIKAQTHQNWRCVFVDDYSNEKDFEWVKNFLSSDERFRIIRNEKNQGVYLTFERGLRELPIEVELIAFCDHEVLAKELSKEPNILLVHSDLKVVDELDRTIVSSFWENEKGVLK